MKMATLRIEYESISKNVEDVGSTRGERIGGAYAH